MKGCSLASLILVSYGNATLFTTFANLMSGLFSSFEKRPDEGKKSPDEGKKSPGQTKPEKHAHATDGKGAAVDPPRPRKSPVSVPLVWSLEVRTAHVLSNFLAALCSLG